MMSNRFVSVLTACALSSVSAAALAQPASAPPEGLTSVTVTAKALPPPKVIIQQASDFVQHYAAVNNPEIDQIGRWLTPVCVVAVGLVPQQAAMVKARIEGVAEEVGLRPAWAKGRDCTPNVEIVFTDKPQAVMDLVAKRREYLLGYYHFHDRNRLKTVTRPIQSWYVTGTRSEGATGAYAGLMFANISGSSRGLPVSTGLGHIDDPWLMSPSGDASSRLGSGYTSELENVFIVADSRALEGRNLGLIADYMVMLALSKPRSLDACNALQSVTDLFGQSACAKPDGLTPADAAYLTGLYTANLEFRKNIEQSDITRRMAAILIKASTEPTSLPPAGGKAR
jgi:hypothetical protein